LVNVPADVHVLQQRRQPVIQALVAQDVLLEAVGDGDALVHGTNFFLPVFHRLQKAVNFDLERLAVAVICSWLC